MHIYRDLAAGFAALSLAFTVSPALAQKVTANILYRQDSDVAYHAVVPGYSGPNADVTGACTLDPDPANCPVETAAGPNYTVVGTTLSLGLPDGRVAVVNCVNRFSAKGNYVNRHSCGMPMVPQVEADFTGRNAKLTWTIAGDAKKTESQTYNVVALLPKPTELAEGPAFSMKR